VLRRVVREQVIDLLDAWDGLAQSRGELQYAKDVGRAPRLLFDPLDPDLERQEKRARKFKANRSLRDVERTVNLWVRTPDGSELEGDEP
jgi:hypothetical protein